MLAEQERQGLIQVEPSSKWLGMMTTAEKKTHAVGTKKSNAWGLHDMHGNVWEWCADLYADKLSGGTDPSGPSSGIDRESRGENRLYRGGSWSFDVGHCRAAKRGWYYPAYRDFLWGFRPALVPSEKQDK